MQTAAGFALLAALLAALPAAVSAQERPTLVQTFRDWHVYTVGSGGSRLCYALSQPRETSPTNVNRGGIFFLISTWPGRNVRNEPSIVPGYPYREGGKVQVQVGSDRFEFFTKNDGSNGGAWMEDPADERRLIEAMRRGSQMIVTGTSTRGTVTRDTYSLLGISAALDKITTDCK